MQAPRPRRRDAADLEEEIRQLREQLEQAQHRIERLERDRQNLNQHIERLKTELEAARRKTKRAAAPFSRGKPKAHPKRPGRKPGSRYGRHHRHPRPAQVEEQISVDLPKQCPDCGGPVELRRVESQYQEEIVRRTVTREFRVAIGECQCCQRRVQGRHAMQTSDALGAAAVQMGPEALALAAHLNKKMGLSLGHTAEALEVGFGLQRSRGALYQALARLADKAAPTYQGLVQATRQSLVNRVDETGWRVGGVPRYLWVFVSDEVTVYAILPGRGFEQAASVLEADYRGWLVHDGWAAYYLFGLAYHQSCLEHLIRRCREMAEIASPGAARFPLTMKALLQQALHTRDRYQQDQISPHGLCTATGQLEARLDRLLAQGFRTEANRRLAKHLRHEQPHLFTFLHCPGLDATNHRAEQAIRPAVVARKVWGGNRTENGARTQQILMSVFRTYHQQGKDIFPRLVDLLRSPQPKTLDILPPSPPSIFDP
ncbi:MAG: IS66 family transposase [Terriglobales bacterium]